MNEVKDLFLLILESIGTSELILIGIIALIVFGPRKLPQMAKTIGKTMADFRRTTNEFKSTWEKEAEFYQDELKMKEDESYLSDTSVVKEKTISQTKIQEQTTVETPQIKEVNQEKINEFFNSLKNQQTGEEKNEEKQVEEKQVQDAIVSDKRSWL